MRNHKGILSNILEHGHDSDNRSGRQLDQASIMRLSEQAASQWRDAFSNLLSAFELNGEFGLWAVLGAYYNTHALPQSVTDAVAAGDEHGFCSAMYHAQNTAFVELFERRNALTRLQLADPLPAEALADYARLRKSVTPATTRSAPAAQEVPAAPAVIETPTELCAREWKELSGDRFKAKYMNNRNNRPIYEQALTEGKI